MQTIVQQTMASTIGYWLAEVSIIYKHHLRMLPPELSASVAETHTQRRTPMHLSRQLMGGGIELVRPVQLISATMYIQADNIQSGCFFPTVAALIQSVGMLSTMKSTMQPIA